MTYDFTKYKTEYDAADGLPEGVYTAVITEVKLRDTNAGDEMFDIHYQVTEGQYKGHKDRFTMWLYSANKQSVVKATLSNIKEIVGLMGKPVNDINAAMQAFIDDLAGNQVALKVNGKFTDITSFDGPAALPVAVGAASTPQADSAFW